MSFMFCTCAEDGSAFVIQHLETSGADELLLWFSTDKDHSSKLALQIRICMQSVVAIISQDNKHNSTRDEVVLPEMSGHTVFDCQIFVQQR